MHMVVARSWYVRRIGFAHFLNQRAWFPILESGTEALSRPRSTDRSFCFQEIFRTELTRSYRMLCLEDIWGASSLSLYHASQSHVQNAAVPGVAESRGGQPNQCLGSAIWTVERGTQGVEACEEHFVRIYEYKMTNGSW